MLQPPVLNADPYSPEILEYPYDFFEALRETGPIVSIPKYGIYAVGRHDEVGTVLTDYRRFITSGGVTLSDIRKPGASRPPSPILEVDPPVHTPIRAALTKIISPIVIRKWRAIFEAEADRLAEQVCSMGDIDGVRDIAEAFVTTVFPDVLGLKASPEMIISIGDMNFNQIGPRNEITVESEKRAAPYLEMYQESFQRENLRPDGFGAEIYAAGDTGALDPEIVPGVVRSFVRGGMDTTISGLGLTLNQLARSPQAWQSIRERPELSRVAFEEAIRYESPVQAIFRTTAAETELSGYKLEADKKIAVFVAAANRDPRKWEKPDVFDMTRDLSGGHRAFGAGDHICIGQMIARLETDCMVAALARRARTLELTGTPIFRLNNSTRTLRTLPMRVTRA